MTIAKIWRTLCSLLALLTAGAALGQSVVFINPGHRTEAYWRSAALVMQAAADSLGMQLEVAYMERDHTRNIDFARELIARPPQARPDYVVFSNDYGMAYTLLPMFEAAKIKSFLAFSGFINAAEWQRFGEPRDTFPNWIGSLEPLAEEMGYQTARRLIDEGRARKLFAKDGKLHLIAIAGDRSTPSSILRNQGMRRAASEGNDVVLTQVVYANWNRALAKEKAAWLYARYPEAHLLWAGNDQMAFGAMEALEALGGKTGRDVLFSGVNTSAEALQAVRNGRLTALSGGHFTVGAWAMVMLYDYHRGRDFADEGRSTRQSMSILFSPQEAQRFTERFGKNRYDVDFRPFSKVLNPSLRAYDFSLRRLLDAPPSGSHP